MASRPRPAARRRPVPTVVRRRRRVLLALVLLNGVELAGVFLVGPGFWIGFSVSFALLVADLLYLRHLAVVSLHRKRRRQHRLAWVAAEQAAVRREHDRRMLARQTAARQVLVARDESRRRASSEYVERYTPRTSGS